MKAKKLVGILTAIILALSICIFPVHAAESNVSVARIWNGKYDISWYDGKKTTYNISTAEELAGLSYLCLNKTAMIGVTINLTNDIVLNDTSNWMKWDKEAPKNKWTPIGDTGDPVYGYKPFAGIFNGNGHTISGMYVNTDRPAGLFGYIYEAAVMNLKIDKGVVICNNQKDEAYAGGIAGISERSFIDKCENYGAVLAISPEAKAFRGDLPAYSGGIIGSMHTENMSKLLVYSALAAGGVFVNPYIITDGKTPIATSYIHDCKNGGYIYSKAAGFSGSYAGGIAGYADNGNIVNSLNVGNIRALSESFSLNGIETYYSHQGNIMGGSNRGIAENCYYWDDAELNIGHIGVGEFLNMDYKDTCIGKSKDELFSKDFPKLLGKSFKYVKNDAPHVAAIKSCPITVVLNGSKANISWEKTAKAESYSVYSVKSDKSLKKISTVTEPTANLSNIKSGSKYTIVIKANFKNGTSKEISNGRFTFTA